MWKFIKKNAILVIAFFAALITGFIIKPDRQYLSYYDYKTLTCLFCMSATVCALKNIGFFYTVAQRIVAVFRNLRICVLVLVYITFIGSMLIANDMALITFLPLGFIVLTTVKREEYMAVTFILQNITANLGGMLTPFGNPQNLYLYSRFSIPTGEFVSIMWLPFVVSVVLITISCIIFIPKAKIEFAEKLPELEPWKTVLYLLLFAYSIIIVFRIVPFWTGLIVIPLALLLVDKKALLMVDYPLLSTFVLFFTFSGNLSRIPAVQEFFASLLDKSTLLVSTGLCQFISNVPTAILLSRFTENYRELLWGVNIGGTGTIIASLASLITFREYCKHNPGKAGRYLLTFSAFNFSFLILLTGMMFIVSR